MTDNEILISWISEYVYCPRRFYLKIVENNQAENVYMAEGLMQHQRVDRAKIERRRSIVTITGLPVFSTTYNMHGICDCIECIHNPDGQYFEMLHGQYDVIPIEYKHGKARNEIEYDMQLLAQIVCLQEMFHIQITNGFIYYTGSKQRIPVMINDDEFNKLDTIIKDIQQTVHIPKLIEPEYRKACNKCSVYNICLPRAKAVNAYNKKLWNQLNKQEDK